MIFYSLLVLFFFFYIFDKDGDDGKKKQSLLARGNATMRAFYRQSAFVVLRRHAEV